MNQVEIDDFYLENSSENICYEEILENILKSNLPDIDVSLQILDNVKEILVEESNILYIKSPCVVIGDIHGQFDDILPFIQENKTYVFLGDYVDRGPKSIELILFLCLKKILHKNVFLLKGNHESAQQNEHYGFKTECLQKYNISFYQRANEVFELLSICAIVDRKYFLVHGGISPDIQSIEKIFYFDRSNFNTFLPLLWSDPMETDGFRKSTRGAGYLFGPDKLKEFLDMNNLKYLVRSHQLVMEGFRIMGQCIFIWSAPNYCNISGNIAAIMHITEDNHTFEVFESNMNHTQNQ